MSMEKIEAAAAHMAECLDELKNTADLLEEQLAEARDKYRHSILASLRSLDEAEKALRTLVQDNKPLFAKPKTRVLNGLRVGWMKGKARMEWDSDDAVVKRIEALLPDQVAALIRHSKKPIRDRIADLPAKMLKRLKVSLIDGADAVVVKSAESDVEKLINALRGQMEVDQ